jgi:hypothetical protein
LGPTLKPLRMYSRGVVQPQTVRIENSSMAKPRAVRSRGRRRAGVARAGSAPLPGKGSSPGPCWNVLGIMMRPYVGFPVSPRRLSSAWRPAQARRRTANNKIYRQFRWNPASLIAHVVGAGNCCVRPLPSDQSKDHGTACLRHLRGEFAFALWDDPIDKLFVARDLFGIKLHDAPRHALASFRDQGPAGSGRAHPMGPRGLLPCQPLPRDAGPWRDTILDAIAQNSAQSLQVPNVCFRDQL